MKTKLKSLLALVLSVLIGHAWAADPVATWTDFGNLTSGEYTLTKDAACTVNDDGSITLGGAGLTVNLPSSVGNLAVVMEVSSLPELDSYTLINLPVTDSANVGLMYKGGNLEQEWNNDGNYGNATWTPGEGHYTIAFAYNKSEGTCTYVDGVHKVVNSGLKTASTSFRSFTIGSYKTDEPQSATGMKVHSIRLYGDMFMSANNVGNEIVGSNDEECPITIVGAVTVNAGQTLKTSGYLNFAGSNVINEGGTLEVISGKTTFCAGNRAIKGTVNIKSGATLVASSTDALDYNNTSVFNVYGTLDMSTYRWTLFDGNTFNLYAGCTVTGAGESDRTAWEVCENNTVNILSNGENDSVTIDTPIRMRDSGDVLTFNFNEDAAAVVCSIGGVIDGSGKLSVAASGTMKLTGANTYAGGTVIAEGVTFSIMDAAVLGRGAVTGAGKLVCTGVLPPATAALDDVAWTGTVKIDDMAGQDALNNLNLTKYGNANSTIELGNLGSDTTDKLYFPNTTLDIPADIVISGTVNIRNGHQAGIYNFTGDFSGAGTLKFPYTARSTSTWNISGDFSGFTGTLDFPARTKDTALAKIIFKSASTTTQTFDNGITVADGYALTVNATYPQTMKVLGTIKQGTGSLVALTFANGATIDASEAVLVVNGDVTIADGATVNVTLPAEYGVGTAVLTCNNAEAVAAQLVAPQGLKYVADGNAIKLAVATVNVTIPAAPENTKWFMGETEVSGTIAVDPNTDVTLTLKADEGYAFADGTTSTTVTVNVGETDATVEIPEVTVGPVSNKVARIGETEYETLQAACNDANEGDLVQLIADTEENCVVKEGFNGTIDLGGNTLTGRIFSKSATMTIQNGTIVRKRIGDDTSSSNGAIEIQGGSLTLQDTLSVQILATDVTHLIRLRNSASCVINGGNYSITSTGTDATILYPSASGTTMIVNGGTFTYDTTNASMPSIANIYGTLTVKGGTFNAYGQSYLFNIDNDGGKTYVKDGLFNCSSSGRLTYNNPKPGDTYGYLEFSGGKYACNPETTRGVIAEGYASGLLEDNHYIVSKAYAVGLTVDTAKATVTGLNDVHACGSIVSFTVAANEGFKVTGVTLDGEALTGEENGNYTFTMPEKDVAIVVTTESTSTFDVMINGQPVDDEEALKRAANSTTTMTVPEGTWSGEGNVLTKDGVAYVTFADYYTVVVNGTSVTLKLNKPVIGESTEGADDAFTVTADAVTIKITNYNSALKYGVRVAADINGLSSAEIAPVTVTDGAITLQKDSAAASAFYEVVVSDVDFPTTPAE